MVGGGGVKEGGVDQGSGSEEPAVTGAEARVSGSVQGMREELESA